KPDAIGSALIAASARADSGWPADERLHPRRVGLAGRRIGTRGDELVAERLRGPHGEDRDAGHAAAPLLPVGKGVAQRQAGHRLQRIALIGVAPRQGEAPDHRDPPRPEDDGSRESRAPTVRLEDAAGADALGVVAAEARVRAVDLLE